MNMLGLTGTSGRLGSAILHTILEKKLVPFDQLLIATTSDPNDPKFSDIKSKRITVRKVNFDNKASLEAAFRGVDRLFLISSPDITLDFPNGPVGTGREKHHFNSIDAAVTSGVKHIYYSSIIFAETDVAAVGRAHRRTEDYLKGTYEKYGVTYTIIREGAYVEAWPMFFGNFDIKNKKQDRIMVSAQGGIRYVTVPDLGFANAYIITSPVEKYRNKMVTLVGPEIVTYQDIAKIISEVNHVDFKVQIVSKEEAKKFQLEHAAPEFKKYGEKYFDYWSTFDKAIASGVAAKRDDTLEKILAEHGRRVTDAKEAIKQSILKS